jgi:hypothetical protein
MSGLGNEGFSEKQRAVTLRELDRAIDFAADTAKSGAVVVHTGEFPRPIATRQWAKTKDGKYLFKEYEEEEEKAPEFLVDDETGQIFKSTVRRDMKVVVPIYKKNEAGQYIDINGNPTDNIMERVPKRKEGQFEYEERVWDDFVKLANEYNEGRPESEHLTPQEMAYRETLNTQEMQARGYAAHYSQNYDKYLEEREKLKHAVQYYEGLERDLPEEEKQRMLRAKFGESILPPEKGLLPSQELRKEVEKIDAYLSDINQTAVSHQMQAEEVRKQAGRVTTLDKYALKKSAESYAEAGIHAMRKSQDPDNPIFIAMENIYPEQYGGHPEELKHLILESRNEMAKRLAPTYGQEKAEELAAAHIKGTFDTAHVNTWWKYYQQDQDKTPEQNKEDFNKWALKQVEMLAEEGVIGNIHISDNFGYEDEHLNPGMGNTPWKDMIEVFKKHGYAGKYIAEAGKEGVIGTLAETWAQLGSPVYSAYRPGAAVDTWTDIRHSYFGRVGTPNYLVGEIVPSQDWTLWSGVPLE